MSLSLRVTAGGTEALSEGSAHYKVERVSLNSALELFHGFPRPARCQEASTAGHADERRNGVAGHRQIQPPRGLIPVVVIKSRDDTQTGVGFRQRGGQFQAPAP